MIYLDNAATTQVAPEVLCEMMPYLNGVSSYYGNPGSLHSMGRKAKDAVEKARRQVADFCGCEPDRVIFTSGGSEGNNMVISSAAQTGNVLCSPIEHDSVWRSLERYSPGTMLASKNVMRVLADGRVAPDSVLCALNSSEYSTRRDALASIMRVNNETGVANDIRAIAKALEPTGVLLHSDCVQAAGCVKLELDNTSGLDYITISSHKIHGPKGVGALCMSPRGLERIKPLIYGGHEQEFGLRGGTENVPGIVGFGVACERAMDRFYEDKSRIDSLNELFLSCCAGDPLITPTVPNNVGKILSLRVRGVSAETLVLMMDANNICISAGSACREHEDEPSRVLLAMGLDETAARETVRISFSRYNLKDDVIQAARTLCECAKIIRNRRKTPLL